MFCANCGSELKEGTRFCPECGIRVDSRIVTESAGADGKPEEKAIKPEIVVENKAEEAPQVIVQPVKAKENASAVNSKEGNKINLNSGVANLLVVVGIVSLLVGTALFISRPKEKKPEWVNVAVNEENVAAGKKQDIVDNRSDSAGDIINAEEKIEDTGNIAEVEEKKAVIKTYEYYSGKELGYKIENNEYGDMICIEFGEGYGGTVNIIEWEYSDSGLPLKSYRYNEKGSVVIEEEYNLNGEPVIYREQHYDEEDKLESEYYSTYEYKTDKNGNPEERYKICYRNGVILYEEYDKWDVINENYNCYHGIWYYSDGNEYTEDYYEYNEYGYIVSSTHINSDGYKRILKRDYIYDENGNVIEERRWYEDNPETIYVDYYKYEYDENNNMIAKYQYDEDGTLKYSYFWTYYN